MFDFKDCLGFEFVKAGVFYLEDKPWKGKDKKGRPWKVRASLKMIDERFRKADETVYLIFSGDELKYVGEYTYRLKDRWLKGNYVTHDKYKKIEKEIEDGKEVSIWLARDPYLKTDKIKNFNISKSLEHEILRSQSPEWNKRNQTKKWEDWRQRNCLKVNDIVNNS